MAEKMESLEKTIESSVEENKVCIKFKLQHAIVMATRYSPKPAVFLST